MKKGKHRSIFGPSKDEIWEQIATDIDGTTTYPQPNHLLINNGQGHFGIGTDKRIDRIEARWPSGIVDILRDVACNQIITITEGSHPQQGD